MSERRKIAMKGKTTLRGNIAEKGNIARIGNITRRRNIARRGKLLYDSEKGKDFDRLTTVQTNHGANRTCKRKRTEGTNCAKGADG